MKTFDPYKEIIVGKFYNVPCAALQYYDRLEMVPVIGIEHADPQFDFKEKHYHYDGRFRNHPISGRTNKVIETINKQSDYNFLGIFVMKKKCRRLDTGLVVPDDIWIQDKHWYTSWYRGMLGKSCIYFHFLSKIKLTTYHYFTYLCTT